MQMQKPAGRAKAQAQAPMEWKKARVQQGQEGRRVFSVVVVLLLLQRRWSVEWRAAPGGRYLPRWLVVLSEMRGRDETWEKKGEEEGGNPVDGTE